MPELGPCSIVDCGEPATFLGMNGRRCPAHTPRQPEPNRAPIRPSAPPRPAPVYGDARCDDPKCTASLCVARREGRVP